MKRLLPSIASFLSGYRDQALLLFRFALGGMFLWHGWPKLSGGAAAWEELGQAMAVFGISFAPAFWGFMAAFAEFGGGLMILLGFFYRIGALLLFFTMFTAFSTQISGDKSWLTASSAFDAVASATVNPEAGKGLLAAAHSFAVGFSFFAAAFIGPGKYSLDRLLGFEGDAVQGKRGCRE